MRKIFSKSILISFIGLGVSSCDTSSEDSFVKAFSYDLDSDSVLLSLEFNKDVEMEFDFNFSVKDYGQIEWNAPTFDTGLTLGVNLNLAAYGDQDFLSVEKTKRYPNGKRMSSYIESDVLRVRFKPSDRIWTSMYLGTEPDLAYLGTSIELPYLDEDFPDGMILGQRVRNEIGQILGLIVFYGPELEGDRVVNPGGLFFMTNLSDLDRYRRENNDLNRDYQVEDGHTQVFGDNLVVSKKYLKHLRKGQGQDLIQMYNEAAQ